MELSLTSMEIHTYMTKGSTIVEHTGYGIAWKNANGRLFVMFSGSHSAYEITANETVEQLDYTLVQTLGSWGPTQDFRRYLENRTEEKGGMTAFFKP